MPIRVLIADKMPTVQIALRVLVEQQPGFVVVGESADGMELLAHVEITCPDLLLLDWDLQVWATVDLLSVLRQLCPTPYVIVLSSRPDARHAAMAAGAHAFVCKADPPERLLAAIDDCRSKRLTRPGTNGDVKE